jgi:hypothetical protein
LIFYFFIVEGEGGGGMEFFLWSFHWKCGRRRGEKGLIGFSGNVFFIVERVGGFFFAQIDYGGRGRLKPTGLQ